MSISFQLALCVYMYKLDVERVRVFFARDLHCLCVCLSVANFLFEIHTVRCILLVSVCSCLLIE